ncbi:efflux RND transporter periplasmic adaptor subunit [Shewanella maritima]|uniref:efflux RND transporter periplasmic adaptor subunit n=1 Tax=Shewanella maritima TaxID=2520507 RepID=UPI00373636FE
MKKYLLTIIVVIAASVVAYKYYLHNQQNPWTRDGQIRAQVVQITPRVTGEITALNVYENRQVEKGELLFEIDRKPYELALNKAKAANAQAAAVLSKAKNEMQRAKGLEARSPGAVATLDLNNYQYAVDSATADFLASKAAVDDAELNLSYTQVFAPANGFITNLRHHVGAQVVANSAVVALIDEDSFWVEGFFKETDLMGVKAKQEASVTLLSNSRDTLSGVVESVGHGIAKSDGSTGNELLPNVNPSFQWIRLAQRIPVRIKLTQLPQDIELRVGTTASVQIHK